MTAEDPAENYFETEHFYKFRFHYKLYINIGLCMYI